MTRSLPIRAVALHQRDTYVGEDLIKGASVFPFFDSLGQISYLLIVDPLTTNLHVCEPSDVLKVPWFRPVRIREAIRLRDSGLLSRLGALLHFDPWWLLAVEPFSMLDSVPILKATNCVDDFEPAVSGLYFSGDLKAVRTSYVHSGENYSTTQFHKHARELSTRTPELRAVENLPKDDAGGWNLSPFWDR